MNSLTLKGILLGIILLLLAAISTVVVHKLQKQDANHQTPAPKTE